MNMILQDPSHVPAALTMHGARGVDAVVIDFGDSSLREDIDIAKKGGFAIDCDHGGGHVGAPPDLKAAGPGFPEETSLWLRHLAIRRRPAHELPRLLHDRHQGHADADADGADDVMGVDEASDYAYGSAM